MRLVRRLPRRWLPALLLACTAGLVNGTAQSALIDRGGGLIYDSTLDVTWLQDVQRLGSSQSWQEAVDRVARLSFIDTVRGRTWDDWRLPTVAPVDGVAFNHAFSVDGSTDVGYLISSPNSEVASLLYRMGIYDPSTGQPISNWDGRPRNTEVTFLNFAAYHSF